MSICTAEFG